MSTAHFAVRCGRRGYLPFAAVASVRGRRYCLVFAVNASVVFGPVGQVGPAAHVSREKKLVCSHPLTETLKRSRTVSARTGTEVRISTGDGGEKTTPAVAGNGSLQTPVRGNVQKIDLRFLLAHAYCEAVA